MSGLLTGLVLGNEGMGGSWNSFPSKHQSGLGGMFFFPWVTSSSVQGAVVFVPVPGQQKRGKLQSLHAPKDGENDRNITQATSKANKINDGRAGTWCSQTSQVQLS